MPCGTYHLNNSRVPSFMLWSISARPLYLEPTIETGMQIETGLEALSPMRKTPSGEARIENLQLDLQPDPPCSLVRVAAGPGHARQRRGGGEIGAKPGGDAVCKPVGNL